MPEYQDCTTAGADRSHADITTALPATTATTVRGLAPATERTRCHVRRVEAERGSVATDGELTRFGTTGHVVGRFDQRLGGDAGFEGPDQVRVVLPREQVGQMGGGELTDELTLVGAGVPHHDQRHVGRRGQAGGPDGIGPVVLGDGGTGQRGRAARRPR